MEKYIILIECEEECIDLQCEFSRVDSLYVVKISNPFDSDFFITGDHERHSYTEAAKYILDRGRVISIIPIVQKHTINFFRTYIRIEEINRHLAKMKGNL
jgi:hypothetical protein